jgi:flagellar hook-length control protein FliK
MVAKVSARGLPVVSVPSEVLANASFQGARARSARADSDQSAGNDSFAALVDSNTAASNNDNRVQDRVQDRTQDSAPAPRRSDDSQAASDNRARDNAAASDKAASDKAARNDSNDRDAAAKARDDGKADADAKADTARAAKSKADASKSGKSDEPKQASSGDDTAAKDQIEAAQDGTAVATADAVVVANPAAAAPAAAASTTPASDKATAPLAIASAAIAASASLAGETAPASPASEGAGTDTTPAAAANTKTDGTKVNAQGAVGQAVSAAVTPADTTVTAGIANAASAIAAPAGSKRAVQHKNPVVAKEGATTVGEQDGATDTTDAPTTATQVVDASAPAVTPQTGATGKPKADNGMVEAVKADASGNSVTPSAVHAGTHSAAADIGQTLANSSGNGLQAPGAIQTQQTSAAPATAQLTATAATGAAVPLSGLAMEIAASANSGKTRFEIRLDPAELGRIDVRIDIDRHGQVTSHLTVERPETLSMLRQDANQLQRALDNAGLSTGNSGLQFSLRDQSSQGQNDGNQSNPNAQRLVVSEEDSVPAVVAGRSYGRMLGSSSGVDIRV